MFSNINTSFQRTRRSTYQYIITLHVGHDHGFGGGGHASGYPQAWAVMDDFGSLVVVGNWS